MWVGVWRSTGDGSLKGVFLSNVCVIWVSVDWEYMTGIPEARPVVMRHCWSFGSSEGRCDFCGESSFWKEDITSTFS